MRVLGLLLLTGLFHADATRTWGDTSVCVPNADRVLTNGGDDVIRRPDALGGTIISNKGYICDGYNTQYTPKHSTKAGITTPGTVGYYFDDVPIFVDNGNPYEPLACRGADLCSDLCDAYDKDGMTCKAFGHNWGGGSSFGDQMNSRWNTKYCRLFVSLPDAACTPTEGSIGNTYWHKRSEASGDVTLDDYKNTGDAGWVAVGAWNAGTRFVQVGVTMTDTYCESVYDTTIIDGKTFLSCGCASETCGPGEGNNCGTCETCTGNTYSDSTDSEPCQTNDNYAYGVNSGNTGLEICPAGQDSTASQGATCADCAAGHYRVADSPDVCQANTDYSKVLNRFGVVTATCLIDEDSSSGTCQPCGAGEYRTPSMTACAEIIEVCTDDGSATLTRANINFKYWENWLVWFDKDVRVCDNVITIAADVFTGSLDADGMANGCTPGRMKEIQDATTYKFGPSDGMTLGELFDNDGLALMDSYDGPATCSDDTKFGFQLTQQRLDVHRKHLYDLYYVWDVYSGAWGVRQTYDFTIMVTAADDRYCDALPMSASKAKATGEYGDFGGTTCKQTVSSTTWDSTTYTNYYPMFTGRTISKFSAPMRSIYGKNVQSVGANSFHRCDLLSNVAFPIASSYASEAFKDTALTTIVLAGGATYVQSGSDKTFDEGVVITQTADVETVCTTGGETTLSIATSNFTSAMTKAIICDTVETIDGDLFQSPAIKSTMVELELGSNVHTINANAFRNTLLSSVVIPPSVTIGASAFADSQLTSVTFAGAVDIGANAFENTALTTVNIPDGSVGASAFAGTSLTDVTIAAATSIGASAFENILTLNTATIGAIGTIGDSAFAGTSLLTAVTIDSVNILAYTAFDSTVNVQLNTPPASIDHYAITAPALADYSQEELVSHYNSRGFDTCQ